MILTIYQVDAFTDQVFKGNPAAVCPLSEWISDDLLQKIASENNLSETAFYVPKDNKFEIRWFTPTAEVDLCGHATLAAAFVLFTQEGFSKKILEFYSPRSGDLSVVVEEDSFVLNFPADDYKEVELSDQFLELTDRAPIALYKGKTDFMLVFEKQEDIQNLKPNLLLISQIEARGIIVTAKGNDHDFVSRFFAPAVGVNEDPVCGSAHTTLTPFWASQLNKKMLTAFQLSERTGSLTCTLLNDRVKLSGKAVLYLKGEIYV